MVENEDKDLGEEEVRKKYMLYKQRKSKLEAGLIVSKALKNYYLKRSKQRLREPRNDPLTIIKTTKEEILEETKIPATLTEKQESEIVKLNEIKPHANSETSFSNDINRSHIVLNSQDDPNQVRQFPH